MAEFTKMLQSVEGGDTEASSALLDQVYTELRKLAAARMAREASGHTLQPTALVHEAWIRLHKGEQEWANKKHFFAAAAEAMRRILIDRARRKHRERHGGNAVHVDLDQVTIATEDPDETILSVHEAVDQLARRDPLKAEIVKLRYFVGLHPPEIAAALNLSEATLRRHWQFARSWLYATLKTHSKN